MLADDDVIVFRDARGRLCVHVGEAHADELSACLGGHGMRPAEGAAATPGHDLVGRRAYPLEGWHPRRLKEVLEKDDWGVSLAADITYPEDSYGPPVDGLLRLGKAKINFGPVDCASRGITQADIPELIRLATDPELNGGPGDEAIVWAPVHAWWALAELGAGEAIGPLLGLFQRIDDDDDDVLSDQMPRVFAALGPPCIPPLREYLAERSHGLYARTCASSALSAMACQHPLHRDECVAALMAQLERYEDESEELNAFVIGDLLDLKALEAAALMEKAFEAARVDESIIGDWEDAQIALGLKTRRERARGPNQITQWSDKLWTAIANGDPERGRELCRRFNSRDEFDNPLDESEADPGLDEVEEDLDDDDEWNDSSPSDSRLRGESEVESRLDNRIGPYVPYVAPPKVGRNEPCPCGSGKKYKKCCGANHGKGA